MQTSLEQIEEYAARLTSQLTGSGLEKVVVYARSQLHGGPINDVELLFENVSGNQITLTGLASGNYHIAIQGTNSLGQWSDFYAYTEINVSYPWYWTPTMWGVYSVGSVLLLLITAWLLYLRSQSISQIHQLLSADLKTRGKSALIVSRNLSLAGQLFENQETKNTVSTDSSLQKVKQIIAESLDELGKHNDSDEPDNLSGNSLITAMPYFSDYFHNKYHVNIEHKIELDLHNLSYEMQADIYKVIYEAISSAILNSNGRNFSIVIQEFKRKIWLTIKDDENSFSNFNNKIHFDMAMYYIRQIANKYNGSVNTFNDQEKGSQLVLSIPLMNIS